MNFLTKIQKKPQNFSFIQIMRIIEQYVGKNLTNISSDILSFEGNVKLSSSGRDIHSISIKKSRIVLCLNCIGILGIQGSMPFSYTEDAAIRAKNGDRVLIDFLNIFNHRLAQNLYRIEKKYNPALGDKLSLNILKSLSSVGDITKSKFVRRNILSVAALFWSKPHNIYGVIKLMKILFPSLRVKVERFVSAKYKIDEVNQAKLACNLQNIFLGKFAKVITDGIRLHIECNSYEEYCKLLPKQQYRARILNILHLYLPKMITIHFNIKLVESERIIPFLDKNLLFLGWNVWL